MIRLLAGDCRDVLATLPDASVHCVVTSPPYYGLRDYGTAQWDGGDAGCDHLVAPPKRGNASYTNGQGEAYASNLQSWGDRAVPTPYRDTCGKCGATRVDRQIGLEATPDEYLATMVQVFREVRRVMRPDATCWINIGDSYASTPSGSFDKGGRGSGALQGGGFRSNKAHSTIGNGAKPKDLLLMPARLALALQADGWWVRSDIIWHKPNPMPESCTDRPTRSHEYVFLLTKSARYFYDQQGVAEPLDRPEEADRLTPAKFGGALKHVEGFKQSRLHSGNEYRGTPSGTRNARSVWTIATHAYSAAHFATFPPELASRCIRAGTSERGCCAQCGAPWTRQSDTSYERNRQGHSGRTDTSGSNGWDGGAYPNLRKVRTTTGWSPSCTHDAPVVPCIVLDPFFGAGTTGLVADRLGRDCIGIDLNPDYNAMSRARITDDAPLFAQFPVTDPAHERQADLWAEPLAAD